MNLSVFVTPLLFLTGSGTPAVKKIVAKIDSPVKELRIRDLHLSKSAPVIEIEKHRGKKVVVLGFLIEHCVICNLYEPRLRAMLKKYSNEVIFYGVYCDKVDNPQSMKKWITQKYSTIHLLDDHKGKLLNYFGVVTSPSFVLIDKKGVLRYVGAFDDNPGEDLKHKYLEDALNAVVKNNPVVIKHTSPFGCKIIPASG